MKINHLLMPIFLFVGFAASDLLRTAQAASQKEPVNESNAQATFAGGCFWCMESDFMKIEGVKDVISGYTGGTGENPNYKDYDQKGHIEAVLVTYDPSVISYEGLLNEYWRRIDPVDEGGQFCDRGHAYTSAIFYASEKERLIALKSIKTLNESGDLESAVVTKLIKSSQFYPAEDYHQNYYKKNSIQYNFYRFSCGRDKRLKEIWGDVMKTENKPRPTSKYKRPAPELIKNKLTPLQYKITQQEGTEPPFKNEYWDNKKEGIYVDIVSGEPLFSSLDKFKSGTGWPSYTQPLDPGNIVEKEDKSWFSSRTEVRSKHADSHLGHVFNDGPAPTGLRYCINSGALRFVPKDDLEREGYGDYKNLFEK